MKDRNAPNNRTRIGRMVTLAGLWIGLIHVSVFAQNCTTSVGGIDAAKTHKLYLYFPTADDPTFPNYNTNVSPARTFDVAALNPSIGTTAKLIELIRKVVAEDYCEFNVQVIATTSNPATLASPPPRRSTVAIGSDSNGTAAAGFLWGQAQENDSNDAIDVDFARVWAGTYTNCEGTGNLLTGDCTTGALTGANATLERWAQAIGGTAAHEGGHTYGLFHSDENPPTEPEPGPSPLPGEDSFRAHLMPGGYNLTGEDRAGFRRHFSDRGFSILAANVGLSIQSMHNWDLKNPNAEQAQSVAVDFLSTLPGPITIQWFFTLGPWINPVVTGPSGTSVFKGVTYNKYRVTWSTPNPTFLTPGIVAGGKPFHIGLTFTGVDFNQPDAVVVQNVTLFSDPAATTSLILHPRLPAYDSGTIDLSNGTVAINFSNPPDGTRLVLQDAVVYHLPRVADLDSMAGTGVPRTRAGDTIQPWSIFSCGVTAGPDASFIQASSGVPLDRRQPSGTINSAATIPPPDHLRCVIGRLSDPHHVEIIRRVGDFGIVDCTNSIPPRSPGKPGDSNRPPDQEGPGCAGISRDLFPSTTVYIIATFIEPNAKFYDPALKKYVVGPLASRVFYQLSGIKDVTRIRVEPPAPPVAAAQFYIGAATGGNWPVGSMARRFDPDFTFSAQIERQLAGRLRAGLQLGYHSFDATPSAGLPNLGVLNFTGYAKLLQNVGNFRAYLLAGIGGYRFHGSWQPGAQTGLGAEIPINNRLFLTIGPALHVVNGSANTGPLRWIDGTVGFMVQIP